MSACFKMLITIIISFVLLNQCKSESVPETETKKAEFDTFNEKTTTDDILSAVAPDLQGKVAIVTGATSGLGRETTKALRQVNCKVIMAVRDIEKAQTVREEIVWEVKRDKPGKPAGRRQIRAGILIWKLDLGSLQSVLDFAKRYYREGPRKLDFLFLNAGTTNTFIFRSSYINMYRHFTVHGI